MKCQKAQGFPRPPNHLQTALVFVVLLAAALAPLVAASPMSPPPSGSDILILDSLGFSVEITDALAVTHLNASFENPSNLTQESHVAFTLSPTAVITGFRLTVHNETFVGVVKEKQQAQADYDDAVERDEHAVLLTSAGDGRLAFTMNVPANTTASVQAEFAEILPLHHGAQEYTFPLDRIGGQYGPVGDIRVDLKATTSGGWAASTPSGFDFETMESADDAAAYRFHAQDYQPERELRFRLTPHATEYASGGIVSGYEENATAVFTILPPGSGETAIPKDVVLIMDVSGSMDRDNKIEQARDALIEILHQLRPGDRFALITFASQVDVHYQGLQHPTGDPFQDAVDWVNAMKAGGATNISGALDEALQILATEQEESARLPVAVLVTDGKANQGISDQGAIVKAVDDWNTMGARVHTVGIGFRHDYAFLNELAHENQGFYQNMPWDADASEILADFLDRVGTPVLKDVTVTLPGLQARDAHPQPLPDLYAGSHLVYAARIDATNLSGEQEVRIQGHAHEGPRTLELTLDADSIRVVPEAEQLWARQKAATLEYRLELYRGSEDAEAQRDELRTLGVTHQIATTETSWIVVAESGLIDPLPETAPKTSAGGGGGAPAPPTADYDYADPVDPTMPTSPTDPGHPDSAYDRGEQDDTVQHGEEEESPAPALLVLLALFGLLVLALQRKRAA